MRKVFILSLLMVISFLNASYLVDVYHRDYGVIDRTVLVFDTKPQYKIFTNESNIQINLQECRKNISLKKLAIPLTLQKMCLIKKVPTCSICLISLQAWKLRLNH
jgi:hypothetical protein